MQFLDYFEKEIIPSDYSEVSTKTIDHIIKEPLCFEGNELQVQASLTSDWSFEFDTTSVCIFHALAINHDNTVIVSRC